MPCWSATAHRTMPRVLFVGLYYRGERREDWEREYLEVYHSLDESVPRFRQLSDSRVVHVTNLYTAEELRTSPAYNEGFARASMQDGVKVRLDGPDGSHIAWATADPVSPNGWEVLASHAAQSAAASHPAICPGPADAGQSRGVGRVRDRPARHPSGRRHPSGPGRAGRGGE